MKKICKQILAILLSSIIICTSVSLSFAVPNDGINTLSVSIKTDKTNYGVLDSAKITVDVQNTGSKKISNVSIAAFSDDLLYITGSGNSKAEISELSPYETVTLSFETMLSPNSKKINIFQKILIFIKRLFVSTSEFSNSNYEGNTNITTKDIVFSGISTTLTIKSSYHSETKIIEADNIDTFSSALSDLINKETSSENFDSESAMENEFYSKRIIVKSESLDYSDYNPETIIAGPDNTYIVQFSTEDEAISFQSEQESNANVEYAEPDIYLSVDPIDESTSSDVAATSNYNSWGVEYIEADKYANYLIENGYNSTVIVAVVDSGVDVEHSFLKNKLYSYGYDYVANDNKADDEHGHGTHVAGTIVDCMPGLNVKILPVRVLNKDGKGFSSEVAAGIKYAASKGADIINLSLGGGHASIKDDAINYAISKGVTVCTAAGNKNQNTSSYCPAHITTSGHITVAAINSNGTKASFSNYGSAVDVAAPGVGIYSCILNDKYKALNGTSMATPHISAVAAMFILSNPTAKPAKIESLVKSYTKDLGNSGYDTYYGYGVPKLSKAIPQTSYTITYNANGGKGIPSPQSGNTTYTISSTIPTRSGYNFLGWSTSSSATYASYRSGDKITISSNTTLYAVWSKETYKVSYNANGGSGAPATQYGYGSITLSSTKPTRSGYQFLGWSTSSSSSSASYSPGNVISLYNNITLYAVWGKSKVTLSSYSSTCIADIGDATYRDEHFRLLNGNGGFMYSLPTVTTQYCGNGSYDGWQVVSGGAFVSGNNVFITQPGTIVLRYRQGDTYSSDYVINISFYDTLGASHTLKSTPSQSGTTLLTISKGSKVSITSFVWGGTYTKNGVVRDAVWAKTTVNGETGYINGFHWAQS